LERIFECAAKARVLADRSNRVCKLFVVGQLKCWIPKALRLIIRVGQGV
jgi:hypothetical protein